MSNENLDLYNEVKKQEKVREDKNYLGERIANLELDAELRKIIKDTLDMRKAAGKSLMVVPKHKDYDNARNSILETIKKQNNLLRQALILDVI